jgi:hypothetical protein
MAKKSKSTTSRAGKEWPGDLGLPIVVQYRGMPGQSDRPVWWRGSVDSQTPAPPSTSPEYEAIAWEVSTKGFRKLLRLADHYGIERKGDPGWGLALAYAIARDLHPGFQMVYDDWKATLFKMQYGSTPLYPTKEVDNPAHRKKGTGWAPTLVPELLALLADTFGKNIKQRCDAGFSNKRFCEIMAISFDPGLQKPSRWKDKQRRTATLIRRLTEGRRRKKT